MAVPVVVVRDDVELADVELADEAADEAADVELADGAAGVEEAAVALGLQEKTWPTELRCAVRQRANAEQHNQLLCTHNHLICTYNQLL